MNLWDSDIAVSDTMVGQLLSEQFPTLDRATLKLIGQGWDNTLYEVEEGVLFRFPRRTVAVELIKTELSILPSVAKACSPVAVPEPLYYGEPTEAFPYQWYGYQRLEGDTGEHLELNAIEQRQLAESLADFLNKLHNIPTAGVNCGAVAFNRLDTARYFSQFKGNCSPHRHHPAA